AGWRVGHWGRFALHTNPVITGARSIRQAVVAGRGGGRRMVDLDRDVLPRLEGRQRAAIGRLQVERGDNVALADLAVDGELAVAVPTTRLTGLLVGNLGLATDADLS